MPNSTFQRALLTEFKAMAERLKDCWDYPPVLGSVHLAGDGLALEPWPIPPEFWNRMPPPQMLYYIAEKMSEVPDLSAKATKGAIAIFFCCEGWTVPPELNDLPEIQAARRSHEFHKLEVKIETRMVSAMDKDGATYFVQMNRGAEPKGSVEEPSADPEGPTVGGMVFDALDQLSALVLGTERRKRRTLIKEDEDE